MIGYFLVGGTVNAIILSIIAFLLSRFVGDINRTTHIVLVREAAGIVEKGVGGQ